MAGDGHVESRVDWRLPARRASTPPAAADAAGGRQDQRAPQVRAHLVARRRGRLPSLIDAGAAELASAARPCSASGSYSREKQARSVTRDRSTAGSGARRARGLFRRRRRPRAAAAHATLIAYRRRRSQRMRRRVRRRRVGGGDRACGGRDQHDCRAAAQAHPPRTRQNLCRGRPR